MKRSELSQQIKEMIVDVLSEVTIIDKMTSPDEIAQIAKDEKKDPKTVKKALETAKKTGKHVSIAEEEDAEPSSKDIEKDDSVSTISRKLQTTTKEMKSIVNKWKKSEGEEKERLLVRLKDLTKIKKELEGLI